MNSSNSIEHLSTNRAARARDYDRDQEQNREAGGQIDPAVFNRKLVEVPASDPNKLDTVGFIMACEDGSITEEQFEASAQAFVDSGVWKSLQGSWGRAVMNWADDGRVTLN